MKNLFIVFLLLAAFQNGLFAQSWFADNPVWTTYMGNGWTPQTEEICTIGGDTVLGGRTARVFVRRRATLSGSNVYFKYRYGYESGDTLFVWHPSQKVYYPLYSFALGFGDSIKFVEVTGGHFAGDALDYVVDSVFTIQIGNAHLRGQKIRRLYSSSVWGEGMIIESIGMISEIYRDPSGWSSKAWHHFFMDEPNESSHDGPDYLLCQFQNDHFIHQNSHERCDLLMLPTKEAVGKGVASILPNPNDGSFSILLPENEAIEDVEAIDPTGKRWALKRIDLERFEENSPMPAGLYFLVIKASGGKTRVAKMQRF